MNVHGPAVNDVANLALGDRIHIEGAVLPVPVDPQRPDAPAPSVNANRVKVHVSQSVFAAFLGVGKSTVAQWEQGLKKPSGPAARLLDQVDRKGIGTLAVS